MTTRQWMVCVACVLVTTWAVACQKTPEAEKAEHEQASENASSEEGGGEGAGEEGSAEGSAEAGEEGGAEAEGDEAAANEGSKAPDVVALSPEEVAALKAEKQTEVEEWPLSDPRPQDVYKTTSCSIYMGNIDSRIGGLENGLENQPENVEFQRSLAEHIYFKGQVLGSLALMADGQKRVEAILEANPDDVDTLLLHAQIMQSLHVVEAAQASLDKVATLDPENAALGSQQHALDFMSGANLEAVLESKKVAYEQGTTFDNYVSAAQAYEYLGEFTLADRYYGLAERFFEGVAPIPLAWLNVQRGLMAMHSGDYEGAAKFFRAGYERCAEYPMAAEHLAEIEGRLGNTERAIELYEAVVAQTQNPEFIGALAEIYLEQGKEAEAQALIEEADKTNRGLIETYPEAMYWHASDFYLGLGEDPALALEMLEKNFALRPNANAHQALAEAQLANDKLAEATKTVEAMMALPAEFAEKYWTAARVALLNGDAETAAKHEARARELNPLIEEFEDPLPQPAAP